MINPLNTIRDFYETTVRPIQQDVTQSIQSAAEDVQQFMEPAVEVAADLGSAAVDFVDEVGTAVKEEGVLNVAGDILQNQVVQGKAIIDKALNSDNPGEFVNWLVGPEGPKVSSFTEQIPGMQNAIGNFIDSSMSNPVIAGAIGKGFGFEYVPGQDFYTTNESSMQSMFGFHAFYDKVGKALGMDLDENVVHFQANGTDYKLEFWKGSYGSGGAFGGEIGLYSSGSGDRGAMGDLLENIPGYYSSVTGDNQIKMTQTIYNKNNPEQVYFTNEAEGADGTDQKHYWNLAIRTDPGIKHEDIAQRGTLEIENEEMATQMYQALANDPDVTADLSQAADGTYVINYDWRGSH